MSSILDSSKQVPINALITGEFRNLVAVVSARNVKELDKHDALLEKIRTFLEKREQKPTQMATSKAVTELKAMEELAKENVTSSKKLMAMMKKNSLRYVFLFIAVVMLFMYVVKLVYFESQIPLLLSLALNASVASMVGVAGVLALAGVIRLMACFKDYPKMELFPMKQESPIPTLEFVKRKQNLLKCLRDEVHPMRAKITTWGYEDMFRFLWLFSMVLLMSIVQLVMPYNHPLAIATIIDYMFNRILVVESLVLLAYAAIWIYRYKKAIKY